jgi:hypothetical protein
MQNLPTLAETCEPSLNCIGGINVEEKEVIDQGRNLGSDAKGNRKQRAIEALLQYPTRAKAAEVTGMSSVTLWRWMKEPAFREALGAARLEAHLQSLGALQQACNPAIGILVRIMRDTEAPAGSRVRAAEAVVKTNPKSF